MSDQSPSIIVNYVDHDVTVEGKAKTLRFALPIDRVAGQVQNVVSDLYQCQDRLFTPIRDQEGEPDVRWLPDWEALSVHVQRDGHRTSWEGGKALVPNTMPGDVPEVQLVTRSEVVTYLQQEVEAFDAVESLPHYPPRPGSYYLRHPEDYDVENADGLTLEAFVDLFNPDSPQDRDLIKAFIVSPMWGGITGTIPLFLITSDHGVGVGKSSTVEAIASLYEGCVATDAGDNSYELEVALGSNLTRRMVLIDNVKGRQDSAKHEKMITAQEVKTRNLNEGAFMMPNRWLWCMTANVSDLSTDLASRAVVIKIGPAQHGVDFKTLVSDFLADHRDDLIADVLAYLQKPAICEIENPSRWQAWERAVLGKLPEGSDLVDLLRDRRNGVDADTEDALDARHLIETLLTASGWNPKKHNVLIPSQTLREPFSEAMGERMNTQRLWAHIKPLLRVGPLRHCEKTRKSIGGKQKAGLLWEADRSCSEVYGWWESPPSDDDEKPMNILGFPEGGKSAQEGDDAKVDRKEAVAEAGDDEPDWESMMVDIDDC